MQPILANNIGLQLYQTIKLMFQPQIALSFAFYVMTLLE